MKSDSKICHSSKEEESGPYTHTPDKEGKGKKKKGENRLDFSLVVR